jgi:hypothetical protein
MVEICVFSTIEARPGDTESLHLLRAFWPIGYAIPMDRSFDADTDSEPAPTPIIGPTSVVKGYFGVSLWLVAGLSLVLTFLQRTFRPRQSEPNNPNAGG